MTYEMGQRGVKEPINPRRAKMTWAAAGIVETDPDGDEYIGAAKHTNNTGELTAMHVMLCRALARHAGHTEETLHSGVILRSGRAPSGTSFLRDDVVLST